MSKLKIRPQNKHLLVRFLPEMDSEEDKPTMLSLPEGYEKPKSEYVKVIVASRLTDSSINTRSDLGSAYVIVPRRNIQEIIVPNGAKNGIDTLTFHVVQEYCVIAATCHAPLKGHMNIPTIIE